EIDDLEACYRENVKLAEEEHKILNEEPADVIKNVGILKALRTASEVEPRGNVQAPKSRNPKRQKIEADASAESPGPSPGLPNPTSKLKGIKDRSGSVPVIKEPKDALVKIEEGAEGSKGPSAERAGKFFVGADVAYRLAKQKEDPQWIQCTILSITEVGNKKRQISLIQDPEPDDNGAPGQIYKAFSAALIAIPSPDAVLADYPVGKQVLARYPETTTFYRAVVTQVKKDGYRLKFEDDNENEMEVTRRYVLDLNSK
ncbi:MAG: hypothetical protein Q9214_007428, partial [Letrouitia sp. 1 TL-2023]